MVGTTRTREKDVAVDPLDIARWQFGITTVYHFLLVPLTLGLGPMIVIFQTL